jgi:hypothetical protein
MRAGMMAARPGWSRSVQIERDAFGFNHLNTCPNPITLEYFFEEFANSWIP